MCSRCSYGLGTALPRGPGAHRGSPTHGPAAAASCGGARAPPPPWPRPRRLSTRDVARQPSGGESRDDVDWRHVVSGGGTRAEGAGSGGRGGGLGAARPLAGGNGPAGPAPPLSLTGFRSVAETLARCCRSAFSPPLPAPRASPVPPPAWRLCFPPRPGRCGPGGRRQQQQQQSLLCCGWERAGCVAAWPAGCGRWGAGLRDAWG